MKRYEEEAGKRVTLSEVGLDGLEFTWRFQDPEKMQRAAMHLMKCHPHHFAVLPDWGYSLSMSAMAADCLRQAMAEGKLEP